MDTPILLSAKGVPQTTPIYLSLHLAATLNVSAEEARRKVNRQVVT
jgi:hypothetical protein